MFRTAAVILAAGASRRMGTPKQLLPWGTSTILGQVVQSALAVPLDPVVVVLGAHAERVRTAVHPWSDDPRLYLVTNAGWRGGMLTSIQAGIRAVPDGVEHFLVMLGDQPRVTPATLCALLAEQERTGAGILVPTIDGRRGHPISIHGRYRHELLSLPAAAGLRQLLLDHPAAVHEVPVDHDGILLDVDTPAEYERHHPE